MNINVTDIITALIAAACLLMQTRMNKKQDRSEAKRRDGEERMSIILECTEACLCGVHELGANGRTTEALKMLEGYKNKKSAK